MAISKLRFRRAKSCSVSILRSNRAKIALNLNMSLKTAMMPKKLFRPQTHRPHLNESNLEPTSPHLSSASASPATTPSPQLPLPLCPSATNPSSCPTRKRASRANRRPPLLARAFTAPSLPFRETRGASLSSRSRPPIPWLNRTRN